MSSRTQDGRAEQGAERRRRRREEGVAGSGVSGVLPAAAGPLAVDALSGRRLGQELARAVHEGLSGHGEVGR